MVDWRRPVAAVRDAGPRPTLREYHQVLPSTGSQQWRVTAWSEASRCFPVATPQSRCLNARARASRVSAIRLVPCFRCRIARSAGVSCEIGHPPDDARNWCAAEGAGDLALSGIRRGVPPFGQAPVFRANRPAHASVRTAEAFCGDCGKAPAARTGDRGELFSGFPPDQAEACRPNAFEVAAIRRKRQIERQDRVFANIARSICKARKRICRSLAVTEALQFLGSINRAHWPWSIVRSAGITNCVRH